MHEKPLTDHPLWQSVRELITQKNDSVWTEPVVTDNETYILFRDKIFAFTEVIDTLFKKTPAVLTSGTALSTMHSNFQNVRNEINNFLANRNPGHLQNAISYLETNVIPSLTGFLPILGDGSNLPIRQIFDELSEASHNALSRLNTQNAQLKNELEKLSEIIKEQESRLAAFSESAAKERAEAASAVARLEQLYAEQERDRAQKFQERLTDFSDSFDASHESYLERSDEVLTSLNTRKAEAERIVQVVGNIGVTGNYQIIAKKESDEANFWRWATVAVFGFGIAIAASTFVKYWDETINQENVWSIFIRLLYAIAITAPAWYTAKESARHRTNADRARQTELELASLGPFIALMPNDKQIEIREKLTPSYFGKEVKEHSQNSPIDLEKVKDVALDVVKEFKK